MLTLDDVRCRDGSFGAWYRKAPPVPPSSSSALEPALMLFYKYKVVGVRDVANEIWYQSYVLTIGVPAVTYPKRLLIFAALFVWRDMIKI